MQSSCIQPTNFAHHWLIQFRATIFNALRCVVTQSDSHSMSKILGARAILQVGWLVVALVSILVINLNAAYTKMCWWHAKKGEGNKMMDFLTERFSIFPQVDYRIPAAFPNLDLTQLRRLPSSGRINPLHIPYIAEGRHLVNAFISRYFAPFFHVAPPIVNYTTSCQCYDWKAATERHADGDILKSLEINRVRFGISDQLAQILQNTVDELWQPA